MFERQERAENQTAFRFSRQQKTFERSRWVRFAIAAIAVAALLLFFLARQVRVEPLELDTLAQSYVVAQTDFDFVDEDATRQLRQEAIRGLGSIYQMSEEELRQQRAELERRLVGEQSWRDDHPNLSFDEMYRAAELFEAVLLSARFTDPRTLQMLRQQRFPIERIFIFTPLEEHAAVPLPSGIWESVAAAAVQQAPSPQVRQALEVPLTFYRALRWQLHKDSVLERELRQRLQAQVPEKSTHVRAGSRLIDQGEKVTRRHLAMMQAMEQRLNATRPLNDLSAISGAGLLSVLIVWISAAYLSRVFPQLMASNRRLLLLLVVVLLALFVAKGSEYLIIHAKSKWLNLVRYPLFVPFVALVLCNLLDNGVAAFVSTFLSIILTLSLTFERSGFLYGNLVAAFAVILATHSLRHRREIFFVCFKAWLVVALLFTALASMSATPGSVLFVVDLLSAALFMGGTALLAIGFLPLLENCFCVMTDALLLEYLDPDQELVRRLTLEAPGTYQHSIVVGNLAEAAAQAVGANGLFCRVAALYHDVGKVVTPQYFIENRHGVDMHQLLTPRESAQVIIAHVNEGVSLARRYRLPPQIIQVIEEHHGTSLTEYFYQQQLELVGGDLSKVDVQAFRYGGPKPYSKESALIMIADCLEAASRSLDDPSEANVTQLADRLIRAKWADGQFDESLLTLEELATARRVIVRALVASTHSRPKYPSVDEDHPRSEN